jgi:hypothetical protein
LSDWLPNALSDSNTDESSHTGANDNSHIEPHGDTNGNPVAETHCTTPDIRTHVSTDRKSHVRAHRDAHDDTHRGTNGDALDHAHCDPHEVADLGSNELADQGDTFANVSSTSFVQAHGIADRSVHEFSHAIAHRGSASAASTPALSVYWPSRG